VPVKITAFGALNEDSYRMFAEHLSRAGPNFLLGYAGPYPNKRGVSEPGRPLRADALQNEKKRNELYAAVADDARRAGAATSDLLCMPCMSMIGFHSGIEKALGRKIERLESAIAAAYDGVDKVGVLHMRPAAQVIAQIFGPRAVTPGPVHTALLQAAEEEAKKSGRATAVEEVMKTVTEGWRDQGIRHVLFARADAPLAEKGPAGEVEGVEIKSTFAILARAVARQAGLVALALAFFLGPARAANLPAAVDPSRAQSQLPQAQIAPLPEAAAPKAQVPRETAPEGADRVTFTLSSLKVEGMTVYTDAEIQDLYAPLLKKKVSMADLYTVANALTVKYRNDGYILSQVIVPEQTIKNGHAKLQAVEGFIDAVSLKGLSSRRLLEIAQKVRLSKPLNNRDLERAILLINDTAGVSAQAVLSPAARTPGAADLTVVANREAREYSATMDNRGSRYIGPFQLTAAAQENGLCGQDESLALQIATAPDGGPPRPEMAFSSLAWSQALNANGLKLDVSASVTGTHPGSSLRALEIRGIARAATVTLTQNLLRARTRNLWAYAKFDYLDSVRDDALGLGPTADHVRALRAGAIWQFPGFLAGQDSLRVEASHGLNVLRASQKGAPNLTRAGGEPQFFKGTAEFSHLQPIHGRFSASFSVTGQKSADLLLASEEFGIGGANYGSAYDSSELTGEDGVAGRAELRYDASVPYVQGLQGYGFYDLGAVWNRDDAVPAHRQSSLADAGIGARAAVNAHVFGSAELAFPLTRPVAAEGTSGPRVFFSLSARL
jgi:hemolysin activation/secretion protein